MRKCNLALNSRTRDNHFPQLAIDYRKIRGIDMIAAVNKQGVDYVDCRPFPSIETFFMRSAHAAITLIIFRDRHVRAPLHGISCTLQRDNPSDTISAGKLR